MPVQLARTDRHNNPTAMTTAVAHAGGLVEGVDYTRGDSFQAGDLTLYTARLVGDPIEKTIRVIDTATFFTSTGHQRWTYIDMKQTLWTLFNQEQKKRVIFWMYKFNEGGTEMLHLFD